MKAAISFEELLDKDGHLAYTNKGVSMMPLLREGKDIMMIEKKGTRRLKKFDIVLFKRRSAKGSAYVLHRILRVNPDGTYWIVGDNCISGETVEEQNILGIMTAMVRNGRTIRMTNLLCQIYANTWCRWYHMRFFLLRTRHFVVHCLQKIRAQ